MTDASAAGNRLTQALDAITRAVGRVTAWLIIPMVGSLVYEVFARYLFDAPTVWAYDMTYMLYGTFFMLGSAWTLQRGGHIRPTVAAAASDVVDAGEQERHRALRAPARHVATVCAFRPTS